MNWVLYDHDEEWLEETNTQAVLRSDSDLATDFVLVLKSRVILGDNRKPFEYKRTSARNYY